MKKCYIVGAGECSYIPNIESCDLIIAADGGYDTLIALGITPDLLMGDFDSISKIPEGIPTLRFPVRKNETDMYLCYLEGRRRGYSDFSIYGGMGGRSDHSFANLSLLLLIRKNGDTATIYTDNEEFTVLKDEERTFIGNRKDKFSVFAFGGNAGCVSIKNAEYEAENIDLTPEFPLGVSNAFLDTPTTISVKKGALLVILERKKK